jgi:hypothetical protein
MQNIQDYLTTAILVISTTSVAVIALNLCTGLVQLWNRCSKTQSNTKYCLVEKPDTTQPPQIFQPVDNPKATSTNLPEHTLPTPALNDAYTELLALHIQKLPQTLVRTAARRLGIADKVDGRYQRLAILRTQLHHMLKSQPQEVARVIAQLTPQTSI